MAEKEKKTEEKKEEAVVETTEALNISEEKKETAEVESPKKKKKLKKQVHKGQAHIQCSYHADYYYRYEWRSFGLVKLRTSGIQRSQKINPVCRYSSGWRRGGKSEKIRNRRTACFC
jgi:hypothetical protein